VRKWICGIAVLALVLVWAVPILAQPAMMNNAILLGWDGCHRDHVKNLLKEGKLPNLQKLIGEGKLVDVDVTSGATDTKAGWSQILTGYRPEITGVYSNGRYRDIPAGYSVFERLRAQYGAERIATVATIGKSGHCGEINAPFKKKVDEIKEKPKTDVKDPGFKKTTLGKVIEENGVKYLVFEGSPYYTMHHNVDEWHFGLKEDERVCAKALEMLDKYGKKPFFFFVHCAEVDHSGHGHGEKSKEYDDAIISGDKVLGKLVEKLKQLGVYEKTLIYVTADHGFDIDGKGHGYAPYVFLGTNDKKVMRDGTRADITPTILAGLGVDMSKITPPLDGEPLSKPATKPVEKAKPRGERKPKGDAKQATAKPKKRAAVAK